MEIKELNLEEISLETLTELWKKANEKPKPPEPRHGDFGFDEYNNSCATIFVGNKGLKDVSTAELLNYSLSFHVKDIVFNAFDDLKAIQEAMKAEDVETFGFAPDANNIIEVCTELFDASNHIIMSTMKSNCNKALLTLPELKQFIIKLRALVAVLEQKEK